MNQYCNIFIACDGFILNKNVNSEIYKRVEEIENKINNESDGCKFVPCVFNSLKHDVNAFEHFANKVRKSDVVIAIFSEDSDCYEASMLSCVAYENRIPFILVTDQTQYHISKWFDSFIYFICDGFFWKIDELVEHLKEFYLN